MAVSRSLRFQILRRDGHKCRYCGAAAPDAKLTVDHVMPEALGGTSDPSNLVTACDKCNGGKSAAPPDAEHIAQVSEDAVRWAAAVRHAADQMMLEHNARAADQDAFLARWNAWTYDADKKTVPLPADWRSTVDRLRTAGLPLDILLSCIDPAMSNRRILDRFSYMCGVAWNKVTQLQEAAREQLNGSEADGSDIGQMSSDEYQELEADAHRWNYVAGQVFKKVPERLLKGCRDRAVQMLRDHDLDCTDDEVTYYTVLELIDTLAEVSV